MHFYFSMLVCSTHKIGQCIDKFVQFTYFNRTTQFGNLKLSFSCVGKIEIKTTSLLRPVFASPKWYVPYDILFYIKTTSLIRPLLGSPKGGLNIGILL